MKPRRSWPQRLLITFNCLLVLACLGAAFSFSFVERKLGEIDVIVLGDNLRPEVAAGEPRNVLIVGTDSAERLDKGDPVKKGREPGGLLADVIMVLRVDPENESAALLSIPRDTYLPLAGTGGKNKINSAIFGVDGPERLIGTIKSNFAIPIDNYVELDFLGFKELVEVLDGVPISVSTPIRDKTTGLLIEETGCVALDSFQALAYARARHLQWKDPDTAGGRPTGRATWVGSPGSSRSSRRPCNEPFTKGPATHPPWCRWSTPPSAP